MIKAILFDLDGTLINTNNLIIKTFKHVLKKHLNLDISKDELVKYFGEPLESTMKRYYPKNPEFLVEAFRKYNFKIHDKFTEKFNGVEEGLEELREYGLRLAVVTSKKKDTAKRGLKLFDFYRYMEVLVTPEDTKKHKPSAEPVLKACEILGIDPSETIMVGDSYNDILSGNKAGATTCLVKYTAVPIEGVLKYNPDYIIDNIKELLDIVKEKETAAV